MQDIVHRHKQEFIDSLIALAKQAGATNPVARPATRRALRGCSRPRNLLDDPAPWAHARKAAQVLIDQALEA